MFRSDSILAAALLAAFSILIFLIVGVISYIAFRQTKVLEELN